MKKIIVVILLFVLFLGCKNKKEDYVIQTDDIEYAKKDSILYIGNKKSWNYGFKKDTFPLNLPELNYIDGKANYIYDAIFIEVIKASVYENEYNEVYAVTKIEQKYLDNSSLTFYLEDKPNSHYNFPLNGEIFNTDYFNKEIHNKTDEKIKVKVYVSVYERDNLSDIKTVVIDSVKLR